MNGNDSKENTTEINTAPAAIIYALRADYTLLSFDEATARANPFAQFELWLDDAIREMAEESNSMILSTAGADLQPSSRVVLLRGFDERGFVFFTNYTSAKAADIAENPRASLLFYWAPLQRQVRIEGAIEKTERGVSEEYFATRPRESQLGAWASEQSAPLPSRVALEEKIGELETRFAGREVPCPEFWGGYRVAPDSFEFWQGRASRLHDRLRYTRRGTAWEIERLSP